MKACDAPGHGPTKTQKIDKLLAAVEFILYLKETVGTSKQVSHIISEVDRY